MKEISCDFEHRAHDQAPLILLRTGDLLRRVQGVVPGPLLGRLGHAGLPEEGLVVVHHGVGVGEGQPVLLAVVLHGVRLEVVLPQVDRAVALEVGADLLPGVTLDQELEHGPRAEDDVGRGVRGDLGQQLLEVGAPGGGHIDLDVGVLLLEPRLGRLERLQARAGGVDVVHLHFGRPLDRHRPGGHPASPRRPSHRRPGSPGRRRRPPHAGRAAASASTACLLPSSLLPVSDQSALARS